MTEEINQAGEWISIKAAADLLNCSTRTISRWGDAGKIETRVEYQGKQARRYVRQSDIIREAGIIQVKQPKAEVVTWGGSHRTPANSGQNLEVVTGLIWKMALILSGIIIIGGVTIYYLVIGHNQKTEAEIRAAMSEVSQGLSQVKRDYVTGNKATGEALTEKIEEIRTATRTDNQATGEKISRQGEDILRTGDQVTAQAEKIEAQTVEIKELRAAIAELQAGIEVIREEVTRPTPAPAATVPPETGEPVKTPAPATTSEPPAPAEEAGGFLGIF